MNKYLSLGERIVKIGLVDPEIIMFSESSFKTKKERN